MNMTPNNEPPPIPGPPPEPPFMQDVCQSCGRPLRNEGEFGTNADGSRSRDYCRYCFVQGRFIEPDITIGQMVEKIAGVASRMGMSEKDARTLARKNLPELKRWKKK